MARADSQAGAAGSAGTASKPHRLAVASESERVGVVKTYKLYVGGKFPRTESGRFYKVDDRKGEPLANICRASRKDFREAVVAARAAFSGWQNTSAFLRGQILYRIAEMLEGRKEQFVAELYSTGASRAAAKTEVEEAIDRLVYFAGWCDKYQQVFSSVNPVSSSHFNFSLMEPTGVVTIIAPEKSPLLGLVANLAPAIAGGNTVVVLASESMPTAAVSFAEVLHSSDVPGGVVNLLTGQSEELLEHFASHMDVNALVYCGTDKGQIKQLQTLACDNIKRVILRRQDRWDDDDSRNPYLIADTQEIKTTWHPIGR
ncbi:MAG: aldehyde dehydrogenase family protein [Gammaproteobacteria bacterium]|nr:aldehyde dehydrogenase family protein [Gammaproteobacteria bacterium]